MKLKYLTLAFSAVLSANVSAATLELNVGGANPVVYTLTSLAVDASGNVVVNATATNRTEFIVSAKDNQAGAAVASTGFTVNVGTANSANPQNAVAPGTSVSVSYGSAAQGYTFTSWTLSPSSVDAANCGNGGTCTFTMPSGDVTVTANFTAPTSPSTYQLSSSTNNAQYGSITGSANGAYTAGTQITLTAVPSSASYTFTGWTGASSGLCSSSSATCSFSMPTNAVALTANFSLSPTTGSCGTVPSNTRIVQTGLQAANFLQTTFTPQPTEVMAFAFTTGASGMANTAYIARTSSGVIGRMLYISECPGSKTLPLNSAGSPNNRCLAVGSEVATLPFMSNSTLTTTSCRLTPNKTYYINVFNVNSNGETICTTSSQCGYTLMFK